MVGGAPGAGEKTWEVTLPLSGEQVAGESESSWGWLVAERGRWAELALEAEGLG